LECGRVHNVIALAINPNSATSTADPDSMANAA